MNTEGLQSFLEARFGMFIHWGLYSIPARGEWVRQQESIPQENYQPYFETFNPTDYGPRKWAAAAAAAGMRYAVMTTKHHDGFCLFDTQYTDYKATNTPAGRDLIREYVDAFRAEGIKVGFYYSLLDWHHPDYPVTGDIIHPMRSHPDFQNHPGNLSAYVDYMHHQVEELLCNYGKIDMIWFDFSYENLRGEAWRGSELVKMARRLQPGIVIDNRLGGNIKAAEPEDYAGDYASPEQYIPPEALVNALGQPVPWEACITMNDNWGYSASDKNWKTPETLVRTLVNCVSKGGNMLLNVGPTARGELTAETYATLKSLGRWMHENGESIYGCGNANLPKPEWGYYTRKGSRLFAHILDRGIGPLFLRGLDGKIQYARLLADGSEVKLERLWFMQEYPGDVLFNFKSPTLPDAYDTVVELVLKQD